MHQTNLVLIEEIMNHFPTSDILNERTNHICYVLVDLEEISTRYMDLIGRFPKKSSQGNKYIMIAYYFDGNHIRALPIKNRKGPTITKA